MQLGTPLKSVIHICVSYIAIRLARCGLKYNPINPSLCLAKYLDGQNPMKEEALTNPHCGAKTRSGKPCEKFPLASKRRCRLHGGLSTGPKTVEGRGRIAAANTKHGRYVNWREKRAKEKYYLGEIKRLMREAQLAGLLLNK